MLVLSRKPGEKIQIGDEVSVTIVRIGPNTVRVGIEAPRNMNIVRQELVPEEVTAVGGGSFPVGGGEMTAEDLGSSVLATQLRGDEP